MMKARSDVTIPSSDRMERLLEGARDTRSNDVNFSAIDAVGQASSGVARFATLSADLIRRRSDLDTVNFAAA
jgi:hypothetical protein